MLLKLGFGTQLNLVSSAIVMVCVGLIAAMPSRAQAGCTTPTSVPNLNVNSGTWPFSDPNALISNSATISGSASVTYQAGNCIDLRPGFHATAGSAAITFRAFLGVPTPVIYTLSSYSAPTGSTIVIAGSNFGTSQGTSAVSFNNTTAVVTSWSGSTISATVPAGAPSGLVVVTVSGFASNGVQFSVVPPPVVSSLLPSSGPAGSVFSIIGSNFGTTQDSSIAQLNGTSMVIANWADTSIQASVPPNASSGSVVVTVAGKASNGATFTVTPSPNISGLSIYSGLVGMPVTVTGTNFGALQGTVSFGGVPASITNWSTNSITAAVPFGAITGNVVVTVNGGSSNGVLFTIPTQPLIQRITPNFGAVGTAVTILGANFGAVQGSSTVKFDGVTASATSWSDGSIIVPVPGGASSGLISVSANGQTATSAQSFTVNTATGVNIYSVQPPVGNPGNTVTITGTNFGSTQGTGKVKVHGVEATAIRWTNTQIDFAIPPGTAGGDVVVQSAASLASNPGEMAVNGGGPSRDYIRLGGRLIAIENPVPTVLPDVTTLSASSGTPSSTTVTISGAHFGSSKGSSLLRFNGTAATTITSWSDNQVVAQVPDGAGTGNVVVTTNNLTGKGQPFTVTTTVPTLTIQPIGVEMTYLGGSGTFAVSSNINSWTAVSDMAWLTITGGSPGSTNGTVSYTVASFCDAARTGHITFPGTTTVFTVTQDASPALTLSPSEVWDVRVGMTRQFYAYSCGGGTPLPNSALTWILSPSNPQYGMLGNSGQYNAPSAISSPVDATISVTYQGQQATAVVHLATYYALPSGMSVQPNNGAGTSQQFQFEYDLPSSPYYPPNVSILIASDTFSLTNTCYLSYGPSRNNGALELFGDDGVSYIQSTAVAYGFQPAGLYGSGFAFNSQCQMDLYHSWQYFNQGSRILNWNIPMYFEPGYAGGKHIFVLPDISGAGWTRIGDWTAPTPGTLKPTVGIVSPAANATVSGTITISGWAVDNATRSEGAIGSISAYIDGIPIGTATYGQPSSICASTYPGRPGCPNVGYTLQWDTHISGVYPYNGPHTLMIVATDSDQPTNLRTVATQIINISN